MGQKGVTKVMALGLASSLLFSALFSGSVQADQENGNSGSNASSYSVQGEYSSEMLSSNYTKISAQYTAADYQGETVKVLAADAARDLGEAQITDEVYGYGQAARALDLGIGDIVTLTLEVPETALYFVNFDYLSYDESVLPIGMSMMVDGEYPFYECRNLEFESTWISKEEKSYDRYNNEIVTLPEKLIQWESKYLMDGSYRRSLPLKVELEKGSHEFTFIVKEGNFLLGAISLEAPLGNTGVYRFRKS